MFGSLNRLMEKREYLGDLGDKIREISAHTTLEIYKNNSL